MFNWRTHVIFAVPAYLSTALFESERAGGDPLLWFWVGTGGFLITAFVIEILGRAFRSQPKRRWYLALAILAFAGLVRGSLMLGLGVWLDLLQPVPFEFAFRLFGGPVFVVAAYATINAAVESYLAFKRDLTELESDREELSRLRSGYKAEVEAATQRQRDKVNTLLSPPMWELQKLFERTPDSTQLQQALIRLESITNEIIRPLSSQLSQTGPIEVSSRRSFVSQSRLSFPKRVTPRETFSVWFFYVSLVTVSLNAQIVSANSFFGALTVLVAMAPVSGALALLLGPLGRRSFDPTWLAAIFMVNGLLMGALGGLLAISASLASTEALLWQAPSYVFLASSLTYAYGLLRTGWTFTLAELGSVLEELEHLNARLRQQVWLRQKSLAMELHGSVQAKLQALSKTISNLEQDDLPKVTNLIIEIRESLKKIEMGDYLDGSSFEKLTADLQLLWEGTVDIEFAYDDAASELLARDEGLARCAFEILREAVTNSVKHGDASAVRVSASGDEVGLALSIWNNGRAIMNPQENVGMSLVRQLCSSFEIENVTGGVELRARITSSLESAE